MIQCDEPVIHRPGPDHAGSKADSAIPHTAMTNLAVICKASALVSKNHGAHSRGLLLWRLGPSSRFRRYRSVRAT